MSRLGDFTATIDAWVAKTEKRVEAVFKQASFDVITQANENAPHRDGFLKSSLVVALNTPIPPAIRVNPNEGNDDNRQTFQPTNFTAVIASAKVTDVISAGWTANYAPAQEWGAKPHKIRPRPGGGRLFLKFRNAAGEDVFAREVDHPGNPPTAFVRRAVSQWQRIVDAAAARAKAQAGR
jgi:hypothetical protein